MRPASCSLIRSLVSAERGQLWFHASSLGDQGAIQPLIARAQAEGYGLIRSAVTRSGRSRARALSPGALHVSPPLLWGAGVALTSQGAPVRCVILELLELWPHWARHAERLGVPMIVVNGRIGEGTMRAGPLLRASFRRLSLFLAQTERDAERARRLGVSSERVIVCGNSKYDHLLSEPVHQGRAPHLPRPLTLCYGALRPEDERALLRVAPLLGGVGVLVAPRYLERSDRLTARLRRVGVRCVRRSAHPGLTVQEWIKTYHRAGLLLLDSYGELTEAYEYAKVALIGGSFGARPQSMIEAALAGCALAVGDGVERLPLEREALAGLGLRRYPSLERATKASLTQASLTLAQREAQRQSVTRLSGASERQWEAISALLA